jgi:hypothetical protein
MKKLALALVCMFSVAFFASCTKTVEHPEPTIAILAGDNFITGTADQPMVINIDDENAINLKYGFHVESNAETKKELASLKITWEYTYYGDEDEETDVFDTIIDLTGKTSYDYSDFLFEQRGTITLMDGTIKAVVTDADNHTSNAAIVFTIEEDEVPLVGYAIEWVRKGANLIGNTAEEMASVGLKWTSSEKEVFATIEPLNNDVALYLCDGDDFDDIVYMSDKYAYFSNLAETADPIEKYRNITTNHSADYNDMLAVVYGDELFLILIDRADIATGTFGTQITITGGVK